MITHLIASSHPDFSILHALMKRDEKSLVIRMDTAMLHLGLSGYGHSSTEHPS
ncbi:hypothetical protein SAMD00023353_2300100 [Rosellinia necatrix]|uniref:Uncharacterized protein n=1 Tax=Rosellinia necatrix TaxID=77044 RepID=A0A1S8A7W7_ROSNE|nr:hypothetical protein SAMD00023353_2300100 [Rosellinia necatrix]